MQTTFVEWGKPKHNRLVMISEFCEDEAEDYCRSVAGAGIGQSWLGR